MDRRARTDPVPRCDGHWALWPSQGLADCDVPLVPLGGLPDHHDQAPGRAQRPPDVGECGARVVEEHRAEPADRQVETPRRKAVDLRVGALKADVAKSLRPGEHAGALDCGRGDVDPERTTCLGHAGSLTGRLPDPTSDVEDVVARLDAPDPAQYRVVQSQFGVIAGALLTIGVHHRQPTLDACPEVVCAAHTTSRSRPTPSRQSCRSSSFVRRRRGTARRDRVGAWRRHRAR